MPVVKSDTRGAELTRDSGRGDRCAAVPLALSAPVHPAPAPRAAPLCSVALRPPRSRRLSARTAYVK